jgi:hypothetical protein
MKLTDFHTTRQLSLTVFLLTFNLQNVSVSYICDIHKHHYDCSHCGPLQLNQCNTNHKLPNITSPTHLGASCLVAYTCNSVQWPHKRSDLCCSSWHDSVTVLAANSWQREALAAISLYHNDGIIRQNQFLNYVIASSRMSWQNKPPCSRLKENYACVA